MIEKLELVLLELKNNLNNIVIKNKIHNKEKNFDYEELEQSISRYIENFDVIKDSSSDDIIQQILVKSKELLDLTNSEHIELYIVKFINLANYLIEKTPNNKIQKKEYSETQIGKLLKKFHSDISQDEFSTRYDKLITLLLSNGETESNLILTTKTNKTNFKLFKNSNNSVVVLAGQEKAAMSISKNKLIRIIYEDEKYTYPAYEEVIIEKILDNTIFSNLDDIDRTSKKTVSIRIDDSLLEEVKKLGSTSDVINQSLLQFTEANQSSKMKEILKDKINLLLNLSNIQITKKEDVKSTLGVDGIANILGSIIEKQPSDSGMMIGIFGKWGRGKTYLFSRVEKYLNNKKENKFKIIRFSAWKYQDTQESWAYLYETFFKSYLKDTNTSNIFYKFLHFLKIDVMWKIFKLNKIKHGLFALLFFIFSIITYTIYSFFVDKVEIIKFILSLGIVFIFKLVLIYFKYKNPAIALFTKYFKRVDFSSVLGLQAEIQKELELLLKAWIPSENDASNKAILFVDDLDRCSIEQIVNVLDGLRIILDDEDIYKRLIIITAIDENILKHAIEYRYKDVLANNTNNNLFKEYLEKVFLIGIKLNPLTDEESKKFLNKLIPQEKIQEQEQDEVQSKVENDDILKDDKDENKQIVDEKDTQTSKEEEFINYEITYEEKEYLLKMINKLENNTPRKIKIFYYKYLIFKQLLHIRLEALNMHKEWIELDYKHLPIDILINYSNGNFDIDLQSDDTNIEQEIKYIIKMISVL